MDLLRKLPARSGHRGLAAAIVATVLAIPATAFAGIDGGCTGSVEIDGTLYGPNNDTVSNPIVVPIDKDGVIANWQGEVPFENMNHDGQLGIVVGPWTIQIAEWGDANTGDDRGNSGSYSVEEFKDLFPVPEWLIPRGIFELSGEHSASGGTCTGTVMVELAGSASAVGVGSALGAVVTLGTMVSAGIRKRLS